MIRGRFALSFLIAALVCGFSVGAAHAKGFLGFFDGKPGVLGMKPGTLGIDKHMTPERPARRVTVYHTSRHASAARRAKANAIRSASR